MSASKLLNKQGFLEFLNNTYKNLNLSNTNFTNFLIDEYYVDNKNKSYYFKICSNYFNNTKKIYNTSKPSTYISYWIDRGWDKEYAKKMVQSKYPKDIVFVDNTDIFQYIIDNKAFGFNINNVKFIKEFVDTIKIDDHISLRQIQETYLYDWSNKFFNTKNAGFLQNKAAYYISRGYSDKEANLIISNNQKICSKRSIEYYTSRGYSKDDAKKKVAEFQSNEVSKSKCTYAYWKKFNLSDEQIREKVIHYNNLRSVWAKKYWINQGLSEDEAAEKVKLYNAGCKECKCYNNFDEYLLAMHNYGDKISAIWKQAHKDKNVDKLKAGWLCHVSKAEQKCFDILKEIDNNIKHEPYIVLFPEGYIASTKNKYFYACDGYLEYNNKVIIIEYDGGIGVFHTEEKDENRDIDILTIDDNVLGILRIQETFLKNKNIKNIKDIIYYELQKIKDFKEERIILT